MISCWSGFSVKFQKTFWGPALKPQGELFLFVCFWFHHYAAAAELKARKWTPEQNRAWPLFLSRQGQDLAPGARLVQLPACMQGLCSTTGNICWEKKVAGVASSLWTNTGKPAEGQALCKSQWQFLWPFQKNVIPLAVIHVVCCCGASPSGD